MADEAIEAAKAALRVTARAARATISAEARAAAAEAAARHFFAGFDLPAFAIVAAYWPIRDEFDCKPILIRLMDSGQPVCLPVTNGDDPLTMRLWRVGDPLEPSGFGTMAPLESAPIVEPDIVLVPLLGFDAKGHRLGYGKGHYDRTIALMTKRPRLIGLAYASQQLDLVPFAQHDMPLDGIVTETGYRSFAGTPT